MPHPPELFWFAHLSNVGSCRTASTQVDAKAGERLSKSDRTVRTRSSSIQDGMAPHIPERRPRDRDTPRVVPLKSAENAA